MAWVISLVSVSSRTMSGLCWLRGIFAGVAFAVACAVWSLRRGASTGGGRPARHLVVMWAGGAAGGLDGGAEPGQILVRDDGGGAGGRAAQRVELGLPGGFGVGEGFLRCFDRGGRGFLRRAGDLAVRVVGGDIVGVEGVEAEVGAGVPEVVLFPPPAGHLPHEAPPSAKKLA